MVEGHGLSRLKQDAGRLLRRTGWWLRTSQAVSALAKEAEVQGNDPARTGTGTGVRKPGGSPDLGRGALPDAAQHCALGWRERGGLEEGESVERGSSTIPEFQTTHSSMGQENVQGRVRIRSDADQLRWTIGGFQ